jgi:hypothetical protein
MRDTAGAATEHQRVVVELTNIAYSDIMRPMELLETADAGLVGDDTLGWLFCAHKTANNNHKIPLFFRAPAKDFHGGRDVGG